MHDTLERLRSHGYTISHGMPLARTAGTSTISCAPRTGSDSASRPRRSPSTTEHLERLRHQAVWAARRRSYPRGVLPIMCVARERNRQLLADGVLIVSPDRLLDAILAADAAA